MSHSNEKRFGEFLRKAISPIQADEPRRDLWPEMLSKMERPALWISWFDWVLGAAAIMLCLLVPEAARGLLLHL